jgi:hypothetical protein
LQQQITLDKLEIIGRTLGAVRRRKGLDRDGDDEGAARRVLLDAGVVDAQRHGAVPGLERPRVGVPAGAGVHGLNRKHAELRVDRHVQLLGLGA